MEFRFLTCSRTKAFKSAHTFGFLPVRWPRNAVPLCSSVPLFRMATAAATTPRNNPSASDCRRSRAAPKRLPFGSETPLKRASRRCTTA
ncbi:hypothetical protein IscW_ISCW022092 [Ixodes scapularis]|uniref:Uncharacterized protein n=1 Tax=Ixodes scapularis TaxID=6945 RepID=B7QAT7_IXOSC|nr:hypothetical protein IscW_ISCW022092 [Ixodes scapularis]|eukprot:XP_002412663.1 hypothetical protein IscW_ISCW022092 [Ixodes scapularis]